MSVLNRMACLLGGHRDVAVREIGIVARPGGILPSIDGYVSYAADPLGDHRACTRCRRVVPAVDR